MTAKVSIFPFLKFYNTYIFAATLNCNQPSVILELGAEKYVFWHFSEQNLALRKGQNLILQNGQNLALGVQNLTLQPGQNLALGVQNRALQR